MKLSQLTKVMDKDEEIFVSDRNAPIDKMLLYSGAVRGIVRDNPINKYHVNSVCADDDTILVLVERSSR